MNLKTNTEYTFTPKLKKDCQMNVRTTKGVKSTIEKIAKENNTSVSDVVNQIILNFLIQSET